VSPAPEGGIDPAGRPVALIKGAGDLATGVALRFLAAGFAVVMTEIERPTVVRRYVALAEAVYEGRAVVEGIEGVRAEGVDQIAAALARRAVPVVVDPPSAVRREIRPLVLVDAVVAKRNLGTAIGDAPAVIALGPGFVAGDDVHAVIETARGHSLGRVIYEGPAQPNTGIPGEVGGFGEERVLRSPGAGVFRAERRIGDRVGRDEVVGRVADLPVRSQLDGVLRGLLRSGLEVSEGFKLGDVDPRARLEHCFTVSDKARAIAGGALEAACALLGGVRFEKARRDSDPAEQAAARAGETTASQRRSQGGRE
jgi:xanthine dehydrogenase accessory factor